MTVLDFELFKDQKKLDKEYLQFMGHCNKFFGTDVSSQETLFCDKILGGHRQRLYDIVRL